MVTTMMTNDAKASMASLLRVVLGVVEDAHRAGVVEHLLARREEHVRLDVLRALKRRDSFEHTTRHFKFFRGKIGGSSVS